MLTCLLPAFRRGFPCRRSKTNVFISRQEKSCCRYRPDRDRSADLYRQQQFCSGLHRARHVFTSQWAQQSHKSSVALLEMWLKFWLLRSERETSRAADQTEAVYSIFTSLPVQYKHSRISIRKVHILTDRETVPRWILRSRAHWLPMPQPTKTQVKTCAVNLYWIHHQWRTKIIEHFELCPQDKRFLIFRSFY